MKKPNIESRMIKVRCLRFDQSVDLESHYQEYMVPLEFGMSVTNILDYIYENLDSSLAYYSNCHRGICGRCAVTINGKRRLACTELVTGDIAVEPLPGHKIVRDLVVEGI